MRGADQVFHVGEIGDLEPGATGHCGVVARPGFASGITKIDPYGGAEQGEIGSVVATPSLNRVQAACVKEDVVVAVAAQQIRIHSADQVLNAGDISDFPPNAGCE